MFADFAYAIRLSKYIEITLKEKKRKTKENEWKNFNCCRHEYERSREKKGIVTIVLFNEKHRFV